MATTFPRAGVRALLATLTGFPASNILFLNEPEPAFSPKAGAFKGAIRMKLRTSKDSAQDEIRRTWNAGTSTLTESTGGQRTHTLEVRLESHVATTPASDVLEELRVRFGFTSSAALWTAQGLALTGTGDIVPIPGVVSSTGNREISTAVMELFLNQAVSIDSATPVGWIEKVNHGHPASPGAAPVVDLVFTPA